MTILISGATGFLGLNLLEVLLGRGDRVVALGAVPIPEPARAALGALPGRLTEAALDARDREGLVALIREHSVRRMVHAAAITPGPARELSDPGTTLEVNILGTVRALEAARETGLERVVCLSSGSVYGAAADGRALLREDEATPRPLTIYGISKFAAERTAARLAALWDLSVAAVRLGTLFGRWEWSTGVRDVLSPPTQAAAMARDGKPIVFTDPYPLDWLYPTDAAEGIVALLDAPVLAHDAYNLSSPFIWTLEDWCRALSSQFPDIDWRCDPAAEAPSLRPLSPVRPPLATDRLAADAGWRARFDLDAAGADLGDWMDRHPGFFKWPPD